MSFFSMVHAPGSYVELRAVDLKSKKVVARAFVQTEIEMSRFCDRNKASELYFGVAPRIKPGDGKLANCLPPRVVWVDIDFKDTDERTAREALVLYDHDPCMIVASGGGLHGYWKYDGDMPGAVAWLKKIAADLGGDVRSAEPAHVLRIPNTFNHKYDPARRVYIEDENGSAPALSLAAEEAAQAQYDAMAIEESYIEVQVSRAGDAAIAKARAWMADREPAVEGMGGDDWTFKTACMLVRDLGLDEDQALEQMWTWNERCDPPWTEEELKKKIRGAMAYGKGDVGSEDPARDFNEYVGKDMPTATEEGLMSKMNRWFKVVDDHGQLVIYRQMYDETMGRFSWYRYRKNGFLEVCQSQLMFGSVEISGGERKKTMPAGQFWLEVYKKKQTYSGLTMMPECPDERTPHGKLNLWRGFAVEAKKGNWSLLKELIYETLCNWDEASYQYILNWMAKAVQMPWKPAGTALVLKGKKGAGKGTLGRAFMRLFGQHGMHITSRYQLSERFNAHLRDCVALFADEAYWAGDKAGESRLKGFITEPFLTYEAKGKDPEMGRNQLHIMMASNSDWIVPAGVDNERRFAVFEAADDSGMSRESWARLNHQLEHGGLEAMLYELMHRDISQFNVFAVPQTEALAEQKIHTLRSSEAWLIDIVSRDYEDLALVDGNVVLMDNLEASMDDFYKRKRIQPEAFASLPMHIGRLVSKIIPDAKKVRVLIEEKRRWGYALPSIEIAKMKIKNLLGNVADF